MPVTSSLQSQLKTVTLLFSALWLSSCVGSPVESYQTKVQKFKWGKMHVWMRRAHDTNTNYRDKEGYGHLLIDFTFKKNVLNEGCVITVSRAHLKNPNTGGVLLDTASSISDSPPLSEKIEQYKMDRLIFGNFLLNTSNPHFRMI